MFKNKFHAKAILLTLLSTTTIASAICVASFTTSQQRQLNTDVNSYLINNPNSNKKYLSSYDYESISDYYQQYYVMDVTKEDVKDPIWDSSNSVWLSPHLDKDITYDRFAYLFYPDTTNVCIYQNSGESFNQCDFKDKSIVTNWISQNGFAYLSSLDKGAETQEEYNQLTTEEKQEYAKANTFKDFFAGAEDVANYFLSGVNHLGGLNNKGVKANINSAKVTKHTIKLFIEYLKSQSGNNEIVLNFNSLYLHDLYRDNSVLALLNPQLWEELLFACKDQQIKISKLDLSHNNLRIVPNIASIRNRNDSDWFWRDTYDYGTPPNKSYLGIRDVNDNNAMCQVFANDGYTIISSLLTGPNPLCDGYFKGIDVSHNNLTYISTNAYNPWEDLPDPITGLSIACKGKSSLLKGEEGGSLRTPGLTTLVKCRYQSDDGSGTMVPDYMRPVNLDVILDPTILKPISSEYMGLNLDYNHLTWIMMNPLSSESENDPNYVWWKPMLASWSGLKLKDIGDIFKATLPDYMLTFVRSYVTYTCSNIKSESLDNILNNLEYIFGLGSYQTDAINITDQEIYNFIMNSDEPLGRSLFNKKSYELDASEVKLIYMYYIEPLFNKTNCISFPLNKKLFNGSDFSVCPSYDDRQFSYKVTQGKIICTIHWNIARSNYLPEEFEIIGDITLNDIGKKLFNAVAVNYSTNVNIVGFQKDFTCVIIVSTIFGVILLAVIIFVIAKTTMNKRKKIKAAKGGNNEK